VWSPFSSLVHKLYMWNCKWHLNYRFVCLHTLPKAMEVIICCTCIVCKQYIHQSSPTPSFRRLYSPQPPQASRYSGTPVPISLVRQWSDIMVAASTTVPPLRMVLRVSRKICGAAEVPKGQPGMLKASNFVLAKIH